MIAVAKTPAAPKVGGPQLMLTHHAIYAERQRHHGVRTQVAIRHEDVTRMKLF